jgi:hypothetical protein
MVKIAKHFRKESAARTRRRLKREFSALADRTRAELLFFEGEYGYALDRRSQS